MVNYVPFLSYLDPSLMQQSLLHGKPMIRHVPVYTCNAFSPDFSDADAQPKFRSIVAAHVPTGTYTKKLIGYGRVLGRSRCVRPQPM